MTRIPCALDVRISAPLLSPISSRQIARQCLFLSRNDRKSRRINMMNKRALVRDSVLLGNELCPKRRTDDQINGLAGCSSSERRIDCHGDTSEPLQAPNLIINGEYFHNFREFARNNFCSAQQRDSGDGEAQIIKTPEKSFHFIYFYDYV